MKEQKKIMVSDIFSAIEVVINSTGVQPKKATKAVENMAKNIAGQLARSQKKEKSTRSKAKI